MEGYERLLTHRDVSGGFSMFPGGKPDVFPTIVAVRQLALYEKITGGRGRPYLESVLRRLRDEKLSTEDFLYLSMLVHDAGRCRLDPAKLLDIRPNGIYQKALLAACPASVPAASGIRESKELRSKLHELLGELVDAGRAPVTGEERGLMGSRGSVLSIEILALTVAALGGAGDVPRSNESLRELLTRECTRSTSALALRAFGKVKLELCAKAARIIVTADDRARQ